MRKIYLHNGWTVKDKTIGKELQATVPGCLHTDLINAGIINDIFYRDNNNKYLYVENCSPVYTTHFDAELSENVQLRFDGIDTFAQIYLNGKHISEVHNMFIPHSFDVSDVLKERDNVLRVEFTSPIKAVEGMPESAEYAFTGDRINARRIQCTYLWDWVDRFVTMGIFRPVYLKYRDGIEIEDVYIRTDAVDSFGASLIAEYELSGIENPGIVNAEIIAPDGKVVYRDAFYADHALVVRKMDIRNPKLWYPTGYGEQPIYTLKASVGGSEYQTSFGIRTLRILNLQDEPGSEYFDKALAASKDTFPGQTRTRDENFFGFKLIINGKEIFCRGGNWVPCDPFASEESDEKLRSLVINAREMGANMLRVWGGGLFEKPSFFDECDRQGILICHDFLMACGVYPEKEKWFIDELLLESEYAVKLMRNHPCLTWFHGDNENAVDGSDLLPDYTGRSSAYDGIFPSIYKHSKGIPFLASSPWGGNTFSSITSGTSHNTNFIGNSFDYYYKNSCEDYKEYLAQFTSRFVSEEPTFGAICRESMLEFMTEDDLLGDDESILKHHAKTNPGLPIHIYDTIRAMAEHVLGEFVDGEDRYFKMKYLQCEWVRVTEELVLRNLGYSNGIIYWMFNDCWPASIGWAFVDYYGRRKPSYYSFKRLSRKVVGSFEVDGKQFTVSNTSTESRSVKVIIRALDKANGYALLDKVEKHVEIDGYSTAKLNIDIPITENTLLVSDVISDGYTYRSYHKTGALHIGRSDKFKVSALTDNSVTIEALDYLQAVEIEGDYNLTDNYFTMLKGEKITVGLEKFSSSANGINVRSYTLI